MPLRAFSQAAVATRNPGRALAAAIACAAGILLASGGPSSAAVWQFSVPVRTHGGKTVRAYLWIPPKAQRLRGLIIGGMTLVEMDLTQDPIIRAAADDEGLGIVFVHPAFDSFFDYRNRAADKVLLKMLADLAKESGYAEIARVPLLTVGQSTGGIFCRNVAYWNPDRVIAVLHVKSGNLHQHIPEQGASLAGVPFLAINGEFEEFGPEGGIRPEYGLETQWIMVRRQLLERRRKDPRHLMSMIVEPGAGHFAWSERLAKYTALYIRKAAQYRIPRQAPKEGAPVRCVAIRPESGWLTDSSIKNPKHAAAPYSDYKGEKAEAFWHFDEQLASAAEAFHKGKFGRADQMVTFVAGGKSVPPAARVRIPFQPFGDGQSFRVAGTFLTRYPHGHARAGKPLGHAAGPVRFRVIRGAAVQTAEHTFRIKAATFGITANTLRIIIMAYHPGDEKHRYAEQPAEMRISPVNRRGKAQKIAFGKIGNQRPDSPPIRLDAASDANLPVEFYVACGPAVVDEGVLKITDVPARARFPVKVSVVAYQWGRPIEPYVRSAEPVEQTFLIERRQQ
jgi:hypothetical protein